MKYILTILFLMDASTTYFFGQKGPTETDLSYVQLAYKVGKDSIRVRVIGKPEYLGVIGINAPKATKTVKCFRPEAA
jgi:hypothetical protein